LSPKIFYTLLTLIVLFFKVIEKNNFFEENI